MAQLTGKKTAWEHHLRHAIAIFLDHQPQRQPVFAVAERLGSEGTWETSATMTMTR